MKVKKLPAATIKTLIHLFTHPQARIIFVSECAYLLDGSNKSHQHQHIPNTALSVLREKEWIITPQNRGYQIAESKLAPAGQAAAANLVKLQSDYNQLNFEELSNVYMLASSQAEESSSTPETTPQIESQAEENSSTPETTPQIESQAQESSSTPETTPQIESQAEESSSTPEASPHPLTQKAAYWQGPAYYKDTLYTIRVLGHCPGMIPPRVYVDLWNDQTPMFSTYADYNSIRLLDLPAAIQEGTKPEEQPATAKKQHKSKEEAKAERQKKRTQMQENMHQAVSTLLESIKAGKSEHLLQYLDFAARLHNYSPLNQLMIALQAPAATYVAGYTSWKKAGYQVKKGEKGIAILAPRPYKKVNKKKAETDEEECITHQGITFSTAYVFDVSQLEENPDKPLPTFFTPLAGEHEVLYNQIAQAVKSEGILLEIGDTGTAQGWSAGGQIRLKSGLDSANRCLTLIHEFAHEKLHHNEASRDMATAKKECHAEAISYIVSAHFGLHNPYSSDYLQNWGNTEKELLAELETIKTAASTIIEAIEAQEAATPAQVEADPPMCYCCQQPTDKHAQILNDNFVCAACIAQEVAGNYLDEIDPPTEQKPEQPTPLTEQEPEPEQLTHPIPSKLTQIQETESSSTSCPQVPEPRVEAHQAKQGAQHVSLNWRSNAFTVSNEGFEKIEALIKEYSTCHRCQQYYRESPNVAGNLCLACFLQWSGKNQGLHYVGVGTPREDGTPEHLFLDQRGIVHVSHPGPAYAEDARENYTETLKYWSFPVPSHIEKAGEAIEIKGANWGIYGDTHRSTVIVHVWECYPDKAEAYFLVSKTGKITQLNKRKASHRNLLAAARKRIDATKSATQYGHKWEIDGEEVMYISEWHEFRMLAQMLHEDASLWP